MVWVRTHASCLQWESDDEPIVYDQEDVVAHHVRMGAGAGMGQKPSDFRTVPLTDRQHRDLHDHGEKGFWLRAVVDPEAVMLALLKVWVGSRWPGAASQLLADPERDTLHEWTSLAEAMNT